MIHRQIASQTRVVGCDAGHLRWALTAAALSAFLLGCSSEPPGPLEPVTQAAAPVMDGTLDAANKYPYVAAIALAGGGAVCSGTLITPFWVLTAAHCFNSPGTPPTSSTLTVGFGPDVANPNGVLWAQPRGTSASPE